MRKILILIVTRLLTDYTTNIALSLPLLRCVDSRHAPTLGRDDRSHRIPRGTRGGLRADGYAGHQKSAQVSKQSSTGESSPDLKPSIFRSRLIGHFLFSPLILCLPVSIIHDDSLNLCPFLCLSTLTSSRSSMYSRFSFILYIFTLLCETFYAFWFIWCAFTRMLTITTTTTITTITTITIITIITATTATTMTRHQITTTLSLSFPLTHFVQSKRRSGAYLHLCAFLRSMCIYVLRCMYYASFTHFDCFSTFSMCARVYIYIYVCVRASVSLYLCRSVLLKMSVLNVALICTTKISRTNLCSLTV